MSARQYWFPFLLTLLFCFSAEADERSASALLTRMQASFAELNFELALIRVQEQRIEPLRFTHGVVDGREVSHLVYLNGPPREVVRRGSLFSYFEIDQVPYTIRAGHLPGVLATLVNGDVARLAASYRLIKVGRSRVAGRPAQVLRVAPTDETRYGYLLWLDSESHLPLRLDTLDRDGGRVEQYMVVSVLVHNEPSPWLLELSRVELPAVVDGRPDSIPSHWHLEWLPEGFKLERSGRHRLSATSQPVEYLQFSDGVVSVSVYISERDSAKPLPSVMVSQGSTSMVSLYRGGREIAVVGEVPMPSAQRMAAAVVPDAQTNID